MRILSLAPALIALLPLSAAAEVAFPPARDAVGAGEPYLLDRFDSWEAWCLRDKAGEDLCESSRELSVLEHGLALDFTVTPYAVQPGRSNADVDVVPVAYASIATFSNAPHYKNYSAAITAVDGADFDGYWCPLNGTKSCLRGPELIQDDLAALLAGKQATVTIYTRGSSPEDFTIVTEVPVDLAGFRAAFDRANGFTAETAGLDLKTQVMPLQMCDLWLEGRQRRISYTWDEVFDKESRTVSEKVLGPRGEGSCPSYVTLAFMTPELPQAQRSMFCLVYDKESQQISGFQQGARDARGICKAPARSLCERVNAGKQAALAITGFAAGAVGSAVGTTAVTGTTVVMHSSGAAILTGSAGYVAGTLGTIGTATLGVLTGPAVGTATAIAVIAVGGAVYLCS